ncbi:hypothetical protein ACFXD5_30725 [Streptomyces sp. NPDC059385]|uniref:hypothetical protein n=1 Tax=Streptomyces sp. NPDC059385 TaxID=3346817 RepID=UPI003696DB7B
MTAWQYFAGAGLVAALCPLHGHVAVAGDGDGRGARVDVCVPGGKPGRPVVRPSATPPVRVPLPGVDLPTVHHPGAGPVPAGSPRPADPGRPEPAVPAAKAGPGDAKPPPHAPDPAPAAEDAPEDAAAAAAAAAPAKAAAGFASAFHVRPYRSVALERRGPGGMSTVMLMVVVTTPAVLAAAALRPRSKSRG